MASENCNTTDEIPNLAQVNSNIIHLSAPICSVSSFTPRSPLHVRHLRDKTTSNAAKRIKMKHALSFGLQAAQSHLGFALNPDGEAAFPHVGSVPTFKLTTTEGAAFSLLIIFHISLTEQVIG